jgi:hypothetical protein
VLPLPIIPFRVRHDRTERSAAADRTEATLAKEPTEKADKNDPIEPIDRTDPTEPIDRIEPREPTHKIEFSDLIDSFELRQVVTSPIMVHQPAWQPDPRVVTRAVGNGRLETREVRAGRTTGVRGR